MTESDMMHSGGRVGVNFKGRVREVTSQALLTWSRDVCCGLPQDGRPWLYSSERFRPPQQMRRVTCEIRLCLGGNSRLFQSLIDSDSETSLDNFFGELSDFFVGGNLINDAVANFAEDGIQRV